VSGLKAGHFTLTKVCVAAGVPAVRRRGGGAAAVGAAQRFAAEDKRLLEVALLTGADVPVCLASRACDMTGVGEGLLPLSLR